MVNTYLQIVKYGAQIGKTRGEGNVQSAVGTVRALPNTIFITVKILKFGTPQTIAIIVLKLVKFGVTLH